MTGGADKYDGLPGDQEGGGGQPGGREDCNRAGRVGGVGWGVGEIITGALEYVHTCNCSQSEITI